MENWIGTKIQPFVTDIMHQSFFYIYKRFNVQGTFHLIEIIDVKTRQVILKRQTGIGNASQAQPTELSRCPVVALSMS
jgi:hypothetical protein